MALTPSPFIVGGRKVLWSDIVLTLSVSMESSADHRKFLDDNWPRIDEDSAGPKLSREERAATAEKSPAPIVVLALSSPPGQSRSHFTIGRDPQCCDIVCADDKVSNRHVKFGFEGDHLVLYDVSSSGSLLRLGERGRQRTYPKPGYPYRCILPPRCKTILKIQNYVFKIEVVYRTGTSLDEFRTRRDAFIANCSDLGALSIATQAVTEAASPRFSPERKWPYMYWFESKLGKGGFGTVHRVRCLQDWCVYAAKELIVTEKDSDSHLDKRRRGLEKEMKALQLLRHKRIVEYMDWYEDVKGRYILVMEYCQYGSLDHIIRQATSALKPHDIAEILKQAAEGLLFLHGRGVAHRDLKPANILVRSRSPLCLALGDFGLSRTEGTSHMETNCGTWPYMAPEIWREDHYTKAIDIWALGVVGLELLNNALPTLSRLRRKEYPDIIFDKVAAMYDQDPENRLVANVRKMLVWDPEDRLPASECIDDANDVLYPEVTAQRSITPQHSTQKRGTDALPRSNSLEAPPPKITRVEEHRRPQERSTDARSRPRDSLGSTGQQPTERKSTSAPPKPNPSGAPKQQPAPAQRRITGTGALSRPEAPGAAARTTPSPERTLRKASPAGEKKGQQKDTRAPPQNTSSYNSPSAVERNTTQGKHALPRASSPAVAAPRQTSIPRGGTSLLPQPPSSKTTAPRKVPRVSGDGKRD